jgi:prepilin-type N-terminal cleavage/methylation domain-containing protein
MQRFPSWPAVTFVIAALVFAGLAIRFFGWDRTVMIYTSPVTYTWAMKTPLGVAFWAVAFLSAVNGFICWLLHMRTPQDGPPLFLPRNDSDRRVNVAKGFTLTELLVAMAIITLMLGMAMAAFNTLTGSHSTAVGQNLLSAALGRVRANAIATDSHHALMFYRDNNTGHVAMVELQALPNGSPYVPVAPLGGYTAEVWFDIANTEHVQLPDGVSLQTVFPNTAGNRYIGFNTYGMFATAPGGCIAFSPDGTLFAGTCGMALGTPANTSPLGRFVFDGPNPTPLDGASWMVPNLALCLFDADAFGSLFSVGGNAWADDPAYGTNEQAKERWLDNNASLFMVGRYNGSLIASQ